MNHKTYCNHARPGRAIFLIMLVVFVSIAILISCGQRIPALVV